MREDQSWIKVQEIKRICKESQTKLEAETKVKDKFPNEDLMPMLRAFRPYLKIRA